MPDTMPPPPDNGEKAPRGPHGCSECDVRWSGLRIAHCSACHRTFTTPANFDRHRAGSRGGRKAGECHDPESCGLVANVRGQWAMPGATEATDR